MEKEKETAYREFDEYKQKVIVIIIKDFAKRRTYGESI